MSTLQLSSGNGGRPNLPGIDVSGGEIHRWADEAWGALVAANEGLPEPLVMVRGNELVRMTERGELEPFIDHSLREELSRAADFYTLAAKNKPRAVPPSLDIARALLHRDAARYVGAPRVDRVVDVPVVSASGELITEPGYHAASRLFYRPASGLEEVTVPDVNYVEDVEDARDFLLEDLLGDFDFEDQASRANALALVMLPFVREYIGDGPTPLYVIDAPMPGSGKTFLAETCMIPACGRIAVTPELEDTAEYRKQITAALLAGTPVVFFDNLKHALNDGAVAAALTSGWWEDRALGGNRRVRLPIRNVWLATGNNVQMNNEMADRTAPIGLEPKGVLPRYRDKKGI